MSDFQIMNDSNFACIPCDFSRRKYKNGLKVGDKLAVFGANQEWLFWCRKLPKRG